MAGLVEFFYNIIPGGLFQTALILTFLRPDLKYIKNVDSGTAALILSVFIITSLFIGFCFQMINTWLNKLGLNDLEDILKDRISDHKHPEIKGDYIKAFRIIKNLVSIKSFDNKKIDEDDKLYQLLRLHHFMDDYIRFKRTSSLHKFFHFRISLWANTMTASIIYAFTTLIASLSPYISRSESNTLSLLFVISTILALACFFATRKSQNIFCDFVLKTFLMATGDKFNETNSRISNNKQARTGKSKR